MVAEKVRQVVSEYVGQEVDPSSSLEVGLKMCPGDIFDLVIELESSFPIMIPDPDALNWVTVQDIEPRLAPVKVTYVSSV
jgi:acyl carrier protein